MADTGVEVPGHGRARLRRLVPDPLVQRVRARLSVRRQRPYGAADRATAFGKVYEAGAWGRAGERFYSGNGSVEGLARPYADRIAALAASLGATHVVDVGCGDFRVGRLLVEAGLRCTGVDVVEPLVADLHARHGHAATFVCLDAVEGPLPEGDLYLVRQVLQHLSNDEGVALLRQLVGRRAVVTESRPLDLAGIRPNVDIEHGPYTRLPLGSAVVLDEAPFSQRCVTVLAEDLTAHERVLTVLLDPVTEPDG